MNNSKTFCMLPFTGIATREDGMIKICCKSHPVGNINTNTLEEVWNNDNMKRIRKQVLNNERPSECSGCFVYEDQGVESMRQRHNNVNFTESRINLYPNILDKLNDDYTLPYIMPSIELRLTNLCNLKCRMCSPLDSTSWNDFNEISDFYEKENSLIGKTIIELKLDSKPYIDSFSDNDSWWTSFEKLIPSLKVVEFAGGEPLMDPSHYRVLDLLSKYGHNIELKYATNLTTLGKGNRNVFLYWPKFKNVNVNVSVDGIGPVFEYIRTNAKWVDILSNIERIRDIPSINRIVCSVSVQATNVLTLDKIIEYFLNDLCVVYWNNFVRYPNILNAQVLPNELKQLAIDRLLSVKEHVPIYKMCQKYPELVDITINQIENVIKYLQGDDYSQLFTDYIEFNHRLDNSRNQGPLETIIPEFEMYVQSNK